MVWKRLYYKLVIKVNAIDAKTPNTSILVIKTQYNSDMQGFEKKIEDVHKNIPDTSGLVKKTDHNTKITEIENKILNVTGLLSCSQYKSHSDWKQCIRYY